MNRENTSYKVISATNRNNEYIASLQDGDLMARINFGGSHRNFQKCLQMTVYKNYKDDSDSYFAHLDGISFNSLCSINGDLQRGDGTKDMIRTGLTFIFIKFPWLKGIKFVDASRVECLSSISSTSNKKPTELKLHSLELAKCGATWYSKNFNAFPDKKRDCNTLKNAPVLLNDTFVKYHRNFAAFYKIYISPKTSLTSLQILNLKETFDGSNSFQSWIKKILKHPNLKCDVLLNWLNDFVYSLVDLHIDHMMWIIKNKKLNNITFTEIKSKKSFIGGQLIEKKQYPFGKTPMTNQELLDI